MTLPDQPPELPDHDPLESTVADLRREIAVLRVSARVRAVLEQARGMLVQRHRISPDEALVRMRRIAREHHLPLVDVAASIVGVAPMAAVAGSLPEDDDQAAPSEVATREWLSAQSQPGGPGTPGALDPAAASTRDGDHVAQVLADLLARHDVAAVAIYRPVLDGSLLLVGQSGLPGDMAGTWATIPPTTQIPLVRVLHDGALMAWESRAAMQEGFPATASVATPFRATAAVPFFEDAEVCGVVGLMWRVDREFPPEVREALTATVNRISPLLLRAGTEALGQDWLERLLSLHLDPWVVLAADESDEGFVVVDAAPQLADGPQWLGQPVRTLWPSLSPDGTAQALRGLLREGGAWTATVSVTSEAPWATVGARVRAVRMGERVALVWRPRGG